MPNVIPTDLKTYVAWRFNAVLPGTFRRAKKAFEHLAYPILSPLPDAGSKTCSVERSLHGGPYVYFVCDDADRVRYVGKSLEKDVIARWTRPGIGGPAAYYFTHSRKGGGCVFSIAEAMNAGESSHFTLRYVPVAEIGKHVLARLGLKREGSSAEFAAAAERALTKACGADWNMA
ncbi:GIY-YIG nuclease family protein [Hydrogenophaga sp. 2FB]|uniref:GIY-YIG nuclease family protein n=1 Tax=Hydrogenophaga sp. 2FB TaxID=2502187 RepID=UPI0010F90F6C|nr:GIY-YIG nuclease family protein [Hydrogenophaga sp. 2FB]